MALTQNKKKFCEYYAVTQNKYDAMLNSGYRIYSYTQAITKANSLLWEKDIQSYLNKLQKESRVSDETIQTRLESLAMFSLADVIGEDGTLTLQTIKDRGLLHHVKKVSYDENGKAIIDFHDSGKFLIKLLESRGLDLPQGEEDVRENAIGFITEDLYDALRED
jgi:phage terminase small subunit